MTTTATSERLDINADARPLYRAQAALDRAVGESALDPGLRDLVSLRASQLNGCAYCVDMHTRDARAAGETEQRLHAVAVWAEAPFFTDRERAALAFTESVTRLAGTHVPDEAYAAVAAEFGADEVGALLSLIVAINAWNALSVASRSWTPEVQGSAA
jgi:AhpD family alkylhydroperoxidase